MQTFTYDLTADFFDGLTPLALLAPDGTGADQVEDVSQPAIGLVSLDVSQEQPEGEFSSNSGDRIVTQLYVRAPAPLPPGSAITIIDVRSSTPAVQRVVEDLTGQTVLFRTVPFRVPQGSVLGITAQGAELVRLEVVPDPTLGDLLDVECAFAGDGDGDGDGDCPCVRYTATIANQGGVIDVPAFGIQRFDASSLFDQDMTLRLPAAPTNNDLVAVKEVGNSTIEVVINGNGNPVELPTIPSVASGPVGIARAFWLWQYDEQSTIWRLR